MIIKSAKLCSYLTFKILGWVVILLASFKLILPFFLPLTIDDVWFEKVVGQYFQKVNIGSVHIVMDDGKVSLLLQNIDTPLDEAQGVHVTRAYVSLSPLKSLLSRKWIFNKVTLFSGDLHMGFGKDHVRLGAVKIPIHPDQQLPVWVHHLNLKNLTVHLDDIPELSDVFVHEIHLLNPKRKGLLKATITEDKSKLAALNIIFNFEKRQDDITGELYVQGYDHNLTRLFKLLQWPGSAMDGKANFKCWASIDKSQILSATLDLEGEDLILRKPHGSLDIKELNGRLRYENQTFEQQWFGENLSLKLEDSVHQTQFSMTSQADNEYTIKGKNFDIGLIHFIVQDVPKVDSFFQSFDLLPKGNIPFVEMIFDKGFTGAPKSVLMMGEDLSFVRDDIEVKNLDGQLYFKDDAITAQLAGQEAILSHRAIFQDPINLKNYDISMHYDLNRQQLGLKAQAGQEGNYLEGQMILFLQDEPLIDFQVRSPKILVSHIKPWIPVKRLSQGLSTWLDKALVSGSLTDISLSYSGLLKDFSSADNANPYQLKGHFDEVKLDYMAPWPSGIFESGHFKIDKHAFVVDAKGRLDQAKGTLKALHASIKDFRSEAVHLQVTTQLGADLNDAWGVLHETKLIDSFFYKEVQFKGPFQLSLLMDFTLNKNIEPQIKGHFTFEEGLYQPRFFPGMTDFSGEINFDNKGLKSRHLSGYILNNPFDHKLKIDFGKQGSLRLESTGLLKTQTILPSISQGSAPLNAEFKWSFSQKHATANGSIDLSHVKIDAPSPLGIDKGTSDRLTFAADINPGQSAMLMLDLSDKIQSQLSFELDNDRLKEKAVAIHFGASNTISLPEQGWLISGHLGELYVEPWLSFLKAFKQPDAKERQYQFDLDIDDLVTEDFYLKEAAVKGQYSEMNKISHFMIDSPKLKGNFNLDLKDNGLWSIDIEHLYLSKKIDAHKPFDLPWRPIQLKMKVFENASISLKDFDLNLIPNKDGFVIDGLSFGMNQSKINMTGLWQNQNAPYYVKLAGDVKTNNLSHILHGLGKAPTIKGAKGQIHFDVAYHGNLFQPNLSTLRGQAEVDLKSGSIPGVNPGIGRILSLLNLDTLQRRLKFDFSDVTHEGYAFDTMKGRFTLDHGLIKTDELRLEAPTANIDFYGDMSLVSKQVNAEVIVMPNLTGSLPLAAAIAAGNPAIGAAVWLMDKVIGKKIQEMTRYTYVVTGTVESPHVKEMDYSEKNQFTRR